MIHKKGVGWWQFHNVMKSTNVLDDELAGLQGLGLQKWGFATGYDFFDP